MGVSDQRRVVPTDDIGSVSDRAHERRWELTILVGPCPEEAAEEFLLAVQHKFGDHLGAAYAMAPWDESRGVPS